MTGLASQRAYKDAKKALVILEEGGFKAMLAGGCVRDRLLGIAPKDYDVATTATPEQVCTLFEQKGRKIVPTGIDHGTVTLIMPSGPIEITTLRQDIATDGRHAVVAYSLDFTQDAARRDLTINAMYEDRAGGIHDFFGGQQDLKAKVLRFVGDARNRIKEDYLRILRLYRFWSRLGFKPTDESKQAGRELCTGIRHLSQERVTSELLQIFAGEFAHDALAEMIHAGVWNESLPFEHKSVDLAALANCVTTHNQGLARLLVAFLQSGTGDPNKIGTQLRLAHEQATAFKQAARALPLPPANSTQAIKMAWIDALETTHLTLLDFFAPIFQQVPKVDQSALNSLILCEEKFGALRRQPMPINGKDLVRIGFKSGPTMGAALDELKRRYRNQDWRTKEEGLNLARQMLSP